MDAPEEFGMANELLAEPLDALLRGGPATCSTDAVPDDVALQYDCRFTPPSAFPRPSRRAAPAVFVILGVRRSLRVIDPGDIDGCQIRSEIANS